MTLRWVVLDFETASAVDLKKAGAWRYAEDPTTEILCACWSVMGDPSVTWTPRKAESDYEGGHTLELLVADPDVTFIAHNAGFEKAIWRNIMVPDYGFPDIPNSRWHDTMASAAMRVLPQDLEHCVQVLGLGEQKDTEGSRLTRSLSKPRKDGSYDRSPATLTRVEDYCAQDIHTEVALHKRLGWLPPGERSVWLLDQRINERGVRLDLEFIRAAQKIVDEASAPLLQEFKRLTGVNVTQGEKFKSWLGDQGIAVTSLDKEHVAALLGGDIDDTELEDDPGAYHYDLSDPVRRALSIRQLIGSASVKKLARMETCVCADGRARGLLQYHGAGPGRWAGRLLQPQNFPRGTLKEDGEATPVETVVETIMSADFETVDLLLGPPVEAVVSALRHAIISERDRRLVVGDFATIELRVNLALAGQQDKIDLLASGKNPYLDMGELIYKRPIKKTETVEYTSSKGAVLGLGFQMGWKKFRARYAKNETEKFCQDVVNVFRKEWAPRVPSNWYSLEAAAVDAVYRHRPSEAQGVLYQLEDGWLTARLPSGRKLWYFNPRPIRKAMPWDETDIRLAFTYQAMKKGQWATIDAFGGLLTENVVQALARDLMVAAMFKCEKNGLPVVLTVHDEIVTEPLVADADPKALEQIMQDRPDWAIAMNIPVKAECWAGDRYRK
jgi:DNA polymerase